jgi:hypothetical protein
MPREYELTSGLINTLVPVRAEVSSFDVLAREQPALQGRVFGDSGTAEKITARATITLDPADPHNAVIVDLDRVPRSPNGKVEAVADVIILRPAHPNGHPAVRGAEPWPQADARLLRRHGRRQR